jgi:hypothetical protein
MEIKGFVWNGVRHYSLPNDPDTDGDGLLDGEEYSYGNFNGYPSGGANVYSLPDSVDSDGDTVWDDCEYYDGTEPLQKDSALRSNPKLILTPHLGASTSEAQQAVSTILARQVIDFLETGAVAGCVNLPPLSAEAAREVGPWMPLMSALGKLAARLVPAPSKLQVTYAGRTQALDTRPLTDVLITHFHADHWFDLVPLHYAFRYGSWHDRPKPALHLPPGGRGVLDTVASVWDGSVETFEAVHAVALAAAGRPHRHVQIAPPGREVPRLTEAWFC